MKNLFLGASTALLLLTIAPLAQAQSKSLSLTNTVTAVDSCTLNTTQNLNFGTYNPLNDNAGIRSVGQVQIYCAPGRKLIKMNNGNNSSQVYTRKEVGYPTGSGTYYWYYNCQRRMKNAEGQTLAYNFYTDAAYGSTISNELSGAGTSSSNGGFTCGAATQQLTYVDFTADKNAPQVINLFGEILPNQGSTATSGVYTDSMVISVAF